MHGCGNNMFVFYSTLDLLAIRFDVLACNIGHNTVALWDLYSNITSHLSGFDNTLTVLLTNEIYLTDTCMFKYKI